VAINLVVAVAKRMPVIPNQRRRHGWIAEASVSARIGRRSLCDVTLCRLEAIMVTLLSDVSRRRWWWRRVVRRRLWVRTSSKSKGKQQCCHRDQFLHDGSSDQPKAV
jgi:hypothetical protein